MKNEFRSSRRAGALVALLVAFGVGNAAFALFRAGADGPVAPLALVSTQQIVEPSSLLDQAPGCVLSAAAR